MNVVSGFVKVFVSIGLVLLLWWYQPALINSLMDTNLDIIKFLSNLLLPEVYGTQVETALRLLNGEKAMLFGESSLIVTLVAKYFFGL